MATRNTGNMSGIFTSVSAMQNADIKNNQRVELLSGERYQTGPNDLGSGILLFNGNFANPTSSGLQAGDNVSLLTNDANYITLEDVSMSFQTEGITSLRIPTGQTGELERLPEVTGKVYRIKLLCASGAAGRQTGITLEASGVDIESEAPLEDSTPDLDVLDNSFCVIQSLGVTDGAISAGVYNTVECSSFAIIKNAGNTDRTIDLAYEIGEYR